MTERTRWTYFLRIGTVDDFYRADEAGHLFHLADPSSPRWVPYDGSGKADSAELIEIPGAVVDEHIEDARIALTVDVWLNTATRFRIDPLVAAEAVWGSPQERG